MVQGFHVVQPVGQLDQQHADIARHREDEFLEVLRLRGFFRRELQLVELGHPVDQFGYIRAEANLDVADVDFGILYHVVQKAGDDGHFVEAHVCQKVRDADRMGVISLTGIALLGAVMLHGEVIGLAQEFGLHPRVIGADFRDQFFAGRDRWQAVRLFRRRGRLASVRASPFFLSGKGAAVHLVS